MATSVSPGLCASCQHGRTITSDRGSTFLMCMLHKTDPRYPKYPRLPVLECEGWRPLAPAAETSGEAP